MENDDNEIEKIRQEKLQRLMNELKSKKGQSSGEAGFLTEVTDLNFDQFVAEGGVALIDCWAPWCAPCRMIAPVVDELSKKYAGKLRVGKLNTDDNQETAVKMGIMGIPTLLLFKDGKLVDRIVGAYPKNVIESRVKGYL